jgi:hypothetical protein
MISPNDVLGAIADDKSLLLFRAIASSDSKVDTDTLITRLHITKKQYYSRIGKLTRAKLVNRTSGKYFPTSLGKIVYETQTIIGKAVADYWKLKAVDGLENSHSDQMPKEEYDKIIEALIDNDRIKKGLRIKSSIPLEIV